MPSQFDMARNPCEPHKSQGLSTIAHDRNQLLLQVFHTFRALMRGNRLSNSLELIALGQFTIAGDAFISGGYLFPQRAVSGVTVMPVDVI